MMTIMSSFEKRRILYEVEDLIKRHCWRTARHKLLVYAQDYFPAYWKDVYLNELGRRGLKSEIYRRDWK